jgi:hypothetical protein
MTWKINVLASGQITALAVDKVYFDKDSILNPFFSQKFSGWNFTYGSPKLVRSTT